MARKRSVWDGVLYFINILFAVGLLLAYLAYYIPPEVFTLFSFAATGYPVLVIVNVLFAVYWALRLKRKILLSLICIGIGWMHLPRMYQTGSAKRAVNEEDRLKVMSYNVRLFNHYQWIDDPKVSDNIKSLVAKEDPDVLLIQEYRRSGEKAPPEFEYPYSRFNLYMDENAGMAIFSKFPITGNQVVAMPKDTLGGKFMFADIEWQGKTIRFMNVHLASVGLQNNDYILLENPDDQNQEDLEKGLKTIAMSLHRSFIRRQAQVETLEKTVKESPYPVVLTGDFNDVPHSFTYHQIDLLLEDSFLSGGNGFGKTYARSPLPLRIDYIFHDDRLNAFNFDVIGQEYSDHYPVVTSLEWR